MGAMVMGAMVIAKNILFHLIHLHVYKAKSIQTSRNIEKDLGEAGNHWDRARAHTNAQIKEVTRFTDLDYNIDLYIQHQR